MNTKAKTIRPFLGAKDYEASKAFYRDFGFTEVPISQHLSVFKLDTVAFYLQKAYVKDWVDNSMLFMEVENIEEHWQMIQAKRLEQQHEHVRISEIKTFVWGKEYYVHDPSGILWHIGEFS
jgi:hypothetical protein